jgi:hypothetical protein
LHLAAFLYGFFKPGSMRLMQFLTRPLPIHGRLTPRPQAQCTSRKRKIAGYVLKFCLFRRRLTISSPRMAVRSALPWPLRWIAGALMLGFSAAIALWAFEFGKGIAGLDTHAKEELALLRKEVVSLQSDRSMPLNCWNSSRKPILKETCLIRSLKCTRVPSSLENCAP